MLSYSWSASPAGKVTFSNANIYNPIITPVCAGTVQISVTVTSQGMEGCTGGSSTQCVTITSAPASGGCNCAIPCTISGTYTSNGTNYPMNTFNNTYSYGTNVNVSCSSSATFTWTKTSGSAVHS